MSTRVPKPFRGLLPSGSGSVEVLKVTTVALDGTRRDHVEKVVKSTSAEHAFWTRGTGSDLVREGDRYTVVAPTRIRDGGAETTLEFPYFEEFAGDLRQRERTFDDRLLDTVRAVAEFNGRNRVADCQVSASWPPVRTPEIDEIASTFRVSDQAARGLRGRWDGSLDNWTRVRSFLDGAPVVVTHNDLHFHNVVHRGETTVLADLGIADASPAGAELHTVLRHLRVRKAGHGAVDDMFREYTAVIRQFIPDVDEVQVRAAAEVKYFSRFTNLGLASGRSRFAFESSLVGIKRAADLVASRP
ncbi:hypothetical protein [Brevibacterium litoralis]|uniref:hypothetical protein n=1 Tax=Brevibacterium litoralis TaxID=3138935 RepID=UPI0032ECDF00